MGPMVGPCRPLVPPPLCLLYVRFFFFSGEVKKEAILFCLHVISAFEKVARHATNAVYCRLARFFCILPSPPSQLRRWGPPHFTRTTSRGRTVSSVRGRAGPTSLFLSLWPGSDSSSLCSQSLAKGEAVWSEFTLLKRRKITFKTINKTAFNKLRYKKNNTRNKQTSNKTVTSQPENSQEWKQEEEVPTHQRKISICTYLSSHSETILRRRVPVLLFCFFVCAHGFASSPSRALCFCFNSRVFR